ncbi:MAG: hypothetical protein Q4D10_03545 [Bacteroidales bacterium]|nr:hypothetical protein [Bacteroidales bacterium]
MASALQSLYKRHTRPSDLVPVELFNGIVKTLNSALSDDFTAEYPDLCEMIRENNEVFAAFKVHDQCKRMAKLLLDEEGNLKSFEQWSKEAEPISNHHNKVWLRTEYDTAIKRAEQARQWKQFESERDVLPNLRWVPSTAATPGADHMIFWDTVRPVDDPFWSQHKPGDRWGCQCSLEATDDPETDIPAGSEMDEPAPGLDNNPAKDGKLFSDSHPYFPSSCSTCPFNSGAIPATPTNKARDCANCTLLHKCIAEALQNGNGDIKQLAEMLKADKSYTGVEYNPETGGLKATHISHKRDGKDEEKVLGEFTGKQLEVRCQDTIFRKGGTCILEAESVRVNGEWASCLDATIMGERMDIASITKNGNNTVFNTITRKEDQLMKFNTSFEAGAHSLALYFEDPTMFNERAVRDALTRYLGHRHYHGAIDTIYCVLNDDKTDIIVIKK